MAETVSKNETEEMDSKDRKEMEEDSLDETVQTNANKSQVNDSDKTVSKKKGGKKSKSLHKPSPPTGKKKRSIKEVSETGEEGTPAKKKRKSKNPKERTIDPGKLRERPRLSYKDESSSEEEFFGEPVSSDSEADVRLEKRLSHAGLPGKKDAGSLREKPRLSYKDDSDDDMESGFESDVIPVSKKKSAKGVKSGKNQKASKSGKGKKKKAKKAKKEDESDEEFITKSKYVKSESTGTKRPQRNARQLKVVAVESSDEEEDDGSVEFVQDVKSDLKKSEGKGKRATILEKKESKEDKKPVKSEESEKDSNQSTKESANEKAGSDNKTEQKDSIKEKEIEKESENSENEDEEDENEEDDKGDEKSEKSDEDTAEKSSK